jgi:hypothetical protein
MKVKVKLTPTEKRRLRKIKREVKTQYARMERAHDAIERSLTRAGKIPAKVSAAAKLTKKEAEQTIKKMDRFYTKLKRKVKK